MPLMYALIAVSSLFFNVTFAAVSSETLAEFFFRYHVINKNEDQSLSFNEKAFVDNEDLLQRVWQSLKKNSFPSPLKFSIHYADDFMSDLDGFEPLRSAHRSALMHAPSTLKDYIEKSLPEIADLLRSGYKPMTATFEEMQKDDSFIVRNNLNGEKLHVFGVTEKIEKFIFNQLMSEFVTPDFRPRRIFYFGSRVMPRSEVVKRDKELIDFMPILDDGVIKNAVRIGGLTSISDLEICILLDTNKVFSREQLREMGSLVKRKFAQKFKEFFISIRLFTVQKESVIADPVEYINSLPQSKDKPLSRHQFVELPMD